MAFRRLLRQTRTGLYYDGRGGWTTEHQEAFVFADMSRAIRVAKTLEEHTLSLVLKFPDARMDISASLEGLNGGPALNPRSKNVNDKCPSVDRSPQEDMGA